MYGVIYKTENVGNGKVYIGQTTRLHLLDTNLFPVKKRRYVGGGIKIKTAIKKEPLDYLDDTWLTEILEYCNSQDELDIRERHWIKESCPEYNISLGGNGRGKHSVETIRKISKALKGMVAWNKGLPFSEKTRQRMSEAAKGKKLSEETKRKIGEASKGRVKSDEERRNLSKALMGHSVSEEARKKISEAQRGRKHTEKAKRKMSKALKGRIPWNKGRKHSEETKRKMSESHMGIKNHFYGKKHTAETKRKMSKNHADVSGENNPNYGKGRSN